MANMANEVFLSIEGAIAATALRVVEDAVGPNIEHASRLIANGQYAAARDIINQLDVSLALRELDGYLQNKFTQSALFGASQLAPPEEAALMSDPQQLARFEAVVAQFYAIVNDGMRLVKDAADKFIRQQEEGDIKDATFDDGVILKSWGSHLHELAKAGETIPELAAIINNGISKNLKTIVDVGANLTTARVINYGFLVEAQAQGVVSYMVSEVLDNRTCPVCELMHGTVFEVEKALSRTSEIINVTDPNVLKQRAPFPSQSKAGIEALGKMSSADLQAAGYDTPPYHPLCRGILVETDRRISSTTTTITPTQPNPTAAAVRPAPPTPPPPPQTPPPPTPGAAQQVVWSNVDNVDDGIAKLKEVYGTNYVKVSGALNNRRYGSVHSKAAQIENINMMGSELARMQNQYGVNFGKGINPIDRSPGAKAYGRAISGENVDPEKWILGDWRWLSVARGSKITPKQLQWTEEWRNEAGRPWSVWAYNTTEQKIAQTFRHEMGHSFTSKEILEKTKDFLKNVGTPYRGKRHWAKNRTVKDVEAGQLWFKANVSEYGGSNPWEVIAETFAMYTAPGYVKGTLPRALESIADDVIKNAERVAKVRIEGGV